MIPVTLFNANTLSATASINSGPSLFVGGTNAILEWEPQLISGTIRLNPSGGPAPNVLAIGDNSAALTLYGALSPFQVTLSFANTVQWTSVQIYMFFDTTKSVSWIILNSGQYVSGSIAA